MFQFHKGSIKTSCHHWWHELFVCFNSTKVRLRHIDRQGITHTYTCFNSTKVRLRRTSPCWPLRYRCKFQFHKGSIKTGPTSLIPGSATSSFNSTKVRLRQIEIRDYYLSQERFQFHKGSIKTWHQQQSYSHHNLFQFHKGSIKTVHSSPVPPNVMVFQFHKGSIKTPVWWKCSFF